MQDKKTRRSNADRSEAMRASLLDVGRKLFVKQGYMETSTPQIVAAAKVTRGALYHHFADKLDLFRAVVEREAEKVAIAIERSLPEDTDALEGLIAGSNAYFDAMKVPGRARLMLVDGPAVLGKEEMNRIYAAQDEEQLKIGLEEVLAGRSDLPLEALAKVLAAAFDRAALAISQGEEDAPYRKAVTHLLKSAVSPTG
jgi:AcrR family transcriptional regulator